MMHLIFQLPNIIIKAKETFETLKRRGYPGDPFVCSRILEQNRLSGCGAEYSSFERAASRQGEEPFLHTENLIAYGDNLQFLCFLLRERQMEGKLQLIYLDPPFYSKSNYDAVVKLQPRGKAELPAFKVRAYDDSWQEGMDAYLLMLALRLLLMRELLSEEGCIWVHLDWHASHYVKILMDEIFGEKHFVNEVIWNYKSGGTSKRSFAKKHDTLLFYSKTEQYYFNPQQEKSYNRGYKPYRFKGVEEFRDAVGWYTLVNQKDVWQIDMVGRTARERTGYATQKPEALLGRIIASCSREGDLCADFFAGSGTMAAAAEARGRRWLSCDGGMLAAAAQVKRMIRGKSCFQVWEQSPALRTGPMAGCCGTDPCKEKGNSRSAADGTGDRNREGGKLDVKVLTQNGHLVIRLLSYDVDWEKINALFPKEKERSLLAAVVEQDPLCLIDYWTVDFAYDGTVHCPSFFSEDPETMAVLPGRYRRIAEMYPAASGGSATSEEGNGRRAGEKNTGKISIRAVDRFGEQIEAILCGELEEKN